MENINNFFIREATRDDVEDILQITKFAFTEYVKLAEIKTSDALSETYEDVLKDIENVQKMVIVAFLSGKIVGSARVEVFNDSTAYFSRFGVDTGYQNIGVGKAILNVVDSLMMQKKIKQLKLHTGSKITSLIRFYYGRGFYIDSVDKSRGYLRALLCKDYI